MGRSSNAIQARVDQEPRSLRPRPWSPPAPEEEREALAPPADRHEAAAAFVRLAHDGLPGFGFPDAAFLDALLAAPPGAPPAEQVVRRLAGRPVAEASLQAVAQLPPERLTFAADVETAAQGVALARSLAGACAAAGGDPGHPFWELAFVFTFERVLRSGALLRRLAGPREPVDDLADRLAGALARPPLAEAVLDLGVDPSALAARHRALAAEAPLLQLPFAATLHLRRVNGFLRRGLAEEILEGGVAPALGRRVAELVDEALERDLTPDVVAELREDAFACVEEAVAWDGEVADALACCAGLQALRAREDPALRQVYLGSLAAQADVGSDVEEALIATLGDDAEDLFALEQLAQHLGLRGDRTRARRVVRYLATVRRERERFLPLPR